jgi:hypothetical protein
VIICNYRKGILVMTKEKALAEFLDVEENEVKENSRGTYELYNRSKKKCWTFW